MMQRANEGFEGLLEYCVEQIGCNYLSDVRSILWRESMRRVIQSIPAERYSAHEWVDALNYISDAQYKKWLSAKRARETLLNVLRRKPVESTGVGELELRC